MHLKEVDYNVGSSSMTQANSNDGFDGFNYNTALRVYILLWT